MKEQILLIAGCSHAAGAEIDGQMDSEYNRNHSFGNLLAERMGRKPINIASPGSTNPTIARSILLWFSEEYDADTMDVFVVAAWTETWRLEVVAPHGSQYANIFSDWRTLSDDLFLRITQGYSGSGIEERTLINISNKALAINPDRYEILSANMVLQIQYLLNSISVNYIMCNSMEGFLQTPAICVYTKLFDERYYLAPYNRDESFYWKYEQQGYKNEKAKYFHHAEEPHKMYAKELYNFIIRIGLLKD